MNNPVLFSVPGGRGVTFQVSGEGELTGGCRFLVQNLSGVTLFDVFRERGAGGYFAVPAFPETLRVFLTGRYSYQGKWYDCPEGRVQQVLNGGNTTVISFDDNGANNNGERDNDFNDCVVTADLQ
jgi:hypothetical protein